MSYSLSQVPEIASSVIADELKKITEDLFQQSSDKKYIAVSLPLDAIDPLAFLEIHWQKKQFQYYWEKPADDVAVAASGELLHITASGEHRFRKIKKQIEAVRRSTKEFSFVTHSYSGIMCLGGFSFFDTISDDLWNGYEPASFTIPARVVIRDGKFHLLTITADLSTFHSPEDLHEYLLGQINSFKDVNPLNSNGKTNGHKQFISAVEEDETEYKKWNSSVNRAKRLISQRAFKKVVLARHISLSMNSQVSATQLINNLRHTYTNCYNFLVHRPENATFIGSTPERLASFRNNLLLTEALAGSIQRGKTASEDAMLERSLSGSSKNRDEHSFVVRDIEQRLKPLVNSFDRNHYPEVKKLTNVQHLYTPIRADIKSNVDILSIIEQLHPTPAVGGYPRKNAVHYIKELENFERGWYAGPVGWLNSKGLGEFAVAIRSGLLTESKAHFYAGCGIVADSDAHAEWEETNLKFRPMLAALQND